MAESLHGILGPAFENVTDVVDAEHFTDEVELPSAFVDAD